jgi:hypothetical protein
MRGHENYLFEPLQTWPLGEFVEEGFLNLFVVLHGHLHDGGAFLHGIQEPQTSIY